jgi:vacuolar protein-sorting-associated protein 4
MMPVRKCQTAKHFAPTPDGGWSPTYPSDPQGKPMTLMQLDPKSLRCPDLTLDDYMGALARIKPSVNEDDVREHVKWTEEFGQDG